MNKILNLLLAAALMTGLATTQTTVAGERRRSTVPPPQALTPSDPGALLMPMAPVIPSTEAVRPSTQPALMPTAPVMPPTDAVTIPPPLPGDEPAQTSPPSP